MDHMDRHTGRLAQAVDQSNMHFAGRLAHRPRHIDWLASAHLLREGFGHIDLGVFVRAHGLSLTAVPCRSLNAAAASSAVLVLLGFPINFQR